MTIRFPRPVYAPEGTGTPPAPPQDTPPPAPPGTPSLMGAPPAPPPNEPNPPPANFPDNWRDLLSGDDAGLKTEAARYKDPAEMLKSLVETKKMVRAAPKDDPMPGDDKPEELKTWRERNGVPPDPSGYKIAEDIAKRLTEGDKPLMDNFMTAAHKAGKPQAYIDFATGWYVDAMEAQAQQEAAGDKEDMNAAEDALRGDWGASYRQNMDFAINTATQLLGAADVAERFGGSIFDARLPDGTKLGSIPGFVKGMLQAGLAIYGDGGLVGDEAVKGTEARIAEIKKLMASDFNEYVKLGWDKEYEQLIAQRDRAAANRRPV